MPMLAYITNEKKKKTNVREETESELRGYAGLDCHRDKVYRDVVPVVSSERK
jgi:hypothetical protein